MHRLASLILMFQLLAPAWLTGNVGAGFIQQEQAQFEDTGAPYTFGEQINFQVRVQASLPVEELLVYITPEGQQTQWQKMDLAAVQPAATATPAENPSAETGSATGANAEKPITEMLAQVDVRQIPLYPFSRVVYYYEGKLTNGDKITSQIFNFTYSDKRFKWQELKNDAFQIQWNGSDPALGQEILNIAQQGLQQARSLLEAQPPALIRIFAYSSSRDLQSALRLTNQPWVAGHATPELGIVMISVPSGPEKKLELQRQIPHEIMHILQYQVTGNKYVNQPVWLIEGMASVAELARNPEYSRVLSTTVASNSLQPMASLCRSFPREASGAFVAYAQSESFVRFLYQKYGASGIRHLMDTYQNGMGCEEGAASAFNIAFNQLEYRWQQEELGINNSGLVLRNLSPYLLIGLLLVLPSILALLPARAKAAIKESA